MLTQVQIRAASSVIAPYLHLYANAMARQCEQRGNARRKKFKDAKYLVVSICCCDVLKTKQKKKRVIFVNLISFQMQQTQQVNV